MVRKISRESRTTMNLPRLILFCAALLGMLGVGAGAFGAHALRGRMEPELFNAFATGAAYALAHAAALTGLAHWTASRLAGIAALLIAAGALVFSVSLFVMALTEVRALGAITPVGGVLMLGGWALLALAAIRRLPAP